MDRAVLDNVIKIVVMPRTVETVSVYHDQHEKQETGGKQRVSPFFERQFYVQFKIVFVIHDTFSHA
jgi:hypothetical protein